MTRSRQAGSVVGAFWGCCCNGFVLCAQVVCCSVKLANLIPEFAFVASFYSMTEDRGNGALQKNILGTSLGVILLVAFKTFLKMKTSQVP